MRWEWKSDSSYFYALKNTSIRRNMKEKLQNFLWMNQKILVKFSQAFFFVFNFQGNFFAVIRCACSPRRQTTSALMMMMKSRWKFPFQCEFAFCALLFTWMKMVEMGRRRRIKLITLLLPLNVLYHKILQQSCRWNFSRPFIGEGFQCSMGIFAKWKNFPLWKLFINKDETKFVILVKYHPMRIQCRLNASDFQVEKTANNEEKGNVCWAWKVWNFAILLHYHQPSMSEKSS